MSTHHRLTDRLTDPSPASASLFRPTGERILTIPDLSKDQVYPMRLKGISVCFSMIKSVLCGNYVNFGGFRLYGDETLDSALRTFVKLLLSVPHSDLLVRGRADKEWREVTDLCLGRAGRKACSGKNLGRTPKCHLFSLDCLPSSFLVFGHAWQLCVLRLSTAQL